MRFYLILFVFIFTMLIFCSAVFALEKGDWLVRLGPTLVEPNDRSNEVEGITGSGVRVDNQFTLGFQIAYFFTNNIALELLGVTPVDHNLQGEGSISGVGNLAEVTLFPPTLSLQYHFFNSSSFKPYVGIGINYTLFSNEDVSSSLTAALGGNTDLDIDNSVGLSGQLGIDYFISESVFLNAAVWYIDLEADAELTTGNTTREVDVDIDPWVLFVGIGRKF